MRKEVFFAVIAGGILGIVIAFGVYRLNKTLKKEPETKVPSKTDKAVTKENAYKISISSPVNNSVNLTGVVNVSGITKPRSYVAVMGEDESEILISSGSGIFETEIPLIGGVNEITAFAFYDQSSEGDSERINLIYSKELGEKSSGETLIANTGTVTDITENSVQIKLEDGEIKQISINKDGTTFANIIKTPKEVTFADLAIGDFIIVMGVKNGSSVITARRILISKTFSPSKKTAFIGKVDTFTSKKFIVKNGKLGREWSINAKGVIRTTYIGKDGSIVTGRLSLVEKGDEIIVAGVPDEKGEVKAQAIHILPAPQRQN